MFILTWARSLCIVLVSVIVIIPLDDEGSVWAVHRVRHGGRRGECGHQENHRALFCPGTICESVAELGHMQDDARALPTDCQCYEPSVRCTKMGLCVGGGKYLCMP